jgi:uridine phosphorylase
MPDELAPSLLTAKQLIAWRGAHGSLPEAVILTHQESLFSALAPRLRARRINGLFPLLRLLPGSSGRIAVAGRIGVGGPATAMAVEELAAAGARRIVMIDVAASISDALVADDVFVAEDALAADGTSRHYLAPDTEIAPAGINLFATLLAALQNAERGRSQGQRRVSWGRIASVDTPFRETAALLESFRAREARLIDMETAALFAASAAVGIEAAALLVVGDQILDAWQPPANPASLRSRLLDVTEVAKAVLLR